MNFFVTYVWYIALGLGMGTMVSILAYYKGALSFSGAIAATIMGTVIFVTSSWYGLLVLMTFFVSSTLLGRLQQDKQPSRRSYKQVLANGGVAMILSLLYGIYGDRILLQLYTISLAVSMADTWSSEIGVLSKKNPRHIFTHRDMTPGLSGAVSPLGLVGALVGSTIIGLLFLIDVPNLSRWYLWVVPIIVLGFLGSLVDSMLGTLQIKYQDETGQLWEDNPPTGGISSIQGFSWLSNDLVNLFSNLIIVWIAVWFLM